MIGGPYIHVDDREGEADVTLADNSKAREILGWEPKTRIEEWIYENKPV